MIARAVAHPGRLAIYRALGERGRSLSDVAREVGLSVAATHHHLDVLRRAGMITKRYSGRTAIYRWSRRRWSLICKHAPE